MTEHFFPVTCEDTGKRIDTWLNGHMTDLSRSALQKLCMDGLISIQNGEKVPKNYKLKGTETVIVRIPDPEHLNLEAQNIPIDILYEDEDLLVVNKQKGMVVHPAPGNYSGTLVNALLYHCAGRLSSINGIIRPGIVHRIDKNTSGLLIVAKNDFSHGILAEQIKSHSFTRIYEAIVYGGFDLDGGSVDAPIGRHVTERKKMCVTQEHSRNAITHYTVLERFSAFSHLRLQLETGRTHQIRVHMAYIGHPVAGDDVYGPKKCITYLHGQCLHAKVIGFTHPRTGQYMEFDSPLPNYFEHFLATLRRKSGSKEIFD